MQYLLCSYFYYTLYDSTCILLALYHPTLTSTPLTLYSQFLSINMIPLCLPLSFPYPSSVLLTLYQFIIILTGSLSRYHFVILYQFYHPLPVLSPFTSFITLYQFHHPLPVSSPFTSFITLYQFHHPLPVLPPFTSFISFISFITLYQFYHPLTSFGSFLPVHTPFTSFIILPRKVPSINTWMVLMKNCHSYNQSHPLRNCQPLLNLVSRSQTLYLLCWERVWWH